MAETVEVPKPLYDYLEAHTNHTQKVIDELEAVVLTPRVSKPISADPSQCWSQQLRDNWAASHRIGHRNDTSHYIEDGFLMDCAIAATGFEYRTCATCERAYPANEVEWDQVLEWKYSRMFKSDGDVPEGMQCGCPVCMPERWPLSWPDLLHCPKCGIRKGAREI